MAVPRRAPGQTRRAIVAALAQQPMVEKEIMLAVGCFSHSTIGRELTRLKQSGLIRRGYVLTPEGEEYLKENCG